MKKAGDYFVNASVFLLILIWVYAACSKLIDFRHFQKEMHNQALFPIARLLLIYALPPAELLIAALLSFQKTILKGLYISLALMTLFSGYILLVTLHFFKHVPCSCGGILEKMGWTTHLYFNIFLLALIIVTLFTIKRKELK